MSHAATNWAIQQRGLKPATKIVLWHLADCHNPAYGCFPTQAYLAEACEMHRDTVNEHLAILEKRGLIRRERDVDPATRRQRPTRYHLLMEGEKPVSETPTRPCGQPAKSDDEPCRNSGGSRVGNSDTNLVKEPVRSPLKDPSSALAVDNSAPPLRRKAGGEGAGGIERGGAAAEAPPRPRRGAGPRSVAAILDEVGFSLSEDASAPVRPQARTP